MGRVDVVGITKRYPGVTALDDITLSIAAGEFFTLLGPSGCGKTTLLRTIAGFNPHDSGEIRIDGRRVDDVPAHARNIGMVYQDYAIFPHKSVAENVGFGLAMRRVPRAEADARVAHVLALVQLDGLGGRMPHMLSGGQQQRVALARAMVINPQLLLMDEPLSNLDAKLRIELRDDIRDLQRSLGTTTVYVTHDQEEALTMSDRICVMQAGRVHQVAAPRDVYARPATAFVASFVGAMNMFHDVPVDGGNATIAAVTRRLAALGDRRRVVLGVRPEDVAVGAGLRAVEDAYVLPATIERITYGGSEALYRMRGPGELALSALIPRPDAAALAAAGTQVDVALPLSALHAFDTDSGARIELSPP